MAEEIFTSYSTVAALFSTKPGWVPEIDKERVQSYDEYDKLYWNHNGNLKLMMRGTDDVTPIYVPEAKTIIDACDRYTGVGFNFQVNPMIGTPDGRALAQATFTALFRREAIPSKYADNKLFGIVRGDWLWHITANTAKPAGSRLRIMPVHPGNYFPVMESDLVNGGDPDKIVKIHIAERIVDPEGKIFVKRQTYEKMVDGIIISSCDVFEEDKWLEEGAAAVETLLPPTALDRRITAFPVYHIRNTTEPLNPWGSSELRGMERILAGLTQAISDEDMALALEGLGVYFTEGNAKFRNTDGDLVSPQLYPGMIMQGSKLQRVQGIGSVQPYGDHIDRLIRFLRESSGTPDVAVGKVDVQAAESGVALTLQLGPMLAKSGKKDLHIIDVHTQMFYDLVNGWYPAYEGINMTDCEVLPILGPKVPPNVTVEIGLMSNLVVAGILSKKTARERLVVLGYVVADDEEARVAAEEAVAAAAANVGAPGTEDSTGAEDGFTEEVDASGEAGSGE